WGWVGKWGSWSGLRSLEPPNPGSSRPTGDIRDAPLLIASWSSDASRAPGAEELTAKALIVTGNYGIKSLDCTPVVRHETMDRLRSPPGRHAGWWTLAAAS